MVFVGDYELVHDENRFANQPGFHFGFKDWMTFS